MPTNFYTTEPSDISADDQVINYLNLRLFIGVLGIALPFVLALLRILFMHVHPDFMEDDAELIDTGRLLLPSVSHYHGSCIRDLFVGYMFFLACFLYSYNGKDKRDNYWSNAAAFFAIVMTFLPCYRESTQLYHFASAVFMLICFVVFSLVIFIRQVKANPEVSEKVRKAEIRIYRFCGWGMVLQLAILGVYHAYWWSHREVSLGSSITFWLEAGILILFGCSWLTKGHAYRKIAANMAST